LFYKLGVKIYHTFPILQPILIKFSRVLYPPEYASWTTTLPWDTDEIENIFLDSMNKIKFFEFNKSITNKTPDSINNLIFRHWYIADSTKHVIKSSNIEKFIFVECGVGLGWSAFFSLQILNFFNKNYEFHLYDTWGAMKKKDLYDYEQNMEGKYRSLDINTTKKNLSSFSKNIKFHQGSVTEIDPDSLPHEISFLHIDLNSAKATKHTLDLFYDRLLNNSIIIFDDYGAKAYATSRNIIDEFLKNKNGFLIKLNTGQAIFFVLK
jgi:hypothetical protein